jgi:hypothetical protein
LLLFEEASRCLQDYLMTTSTGHGQSYIRLALAAAAAAAAGMKSCITQA